MFITNVHNLRTEWSDGTIYYALQRSNIKMGFTAPYGSKNYSNYHWTVSQNAQDRWYNMFHLIISTLKSDLLCLHSFNNVLTITDSSRDRLPNGWNDGTMFRPLHHFDVETAIYQLQTFLPYRYAYSYICRSKLSAINYVTPWSEKYV